MDEYNLEYLAQALGHLSGVPTRLYKDNKEEFFFSLVNLPIDPIILNEKEILDISGHVNFFTADFFTYYGILNYKNYKLIIGPTRVIPIDNKNANEMAFRLNVKKEDLSLFINNVKLIVNMPIESIIETLCAFNYVLNKEILSFKDVIFINRNEKHNEEMPIENETNNIPTVNVVHNAYSIEKQILAIVESGNIEGFDQFVKKAPAVRSGTLSFDYLTQQRNIFVVIATLVSRSAISGGLDVEDSLQLSDLYIQNMQLLKTYEDILKLEYKMVREFTEKVAAIKEGVTSKLTLSLSKYIYFHLSDCIKVQDIADSLYIAKSTLFKKIKEETGKTVDEFILEKKIDEAKRLLKETDKTLSQISLYLGFSSQSHFSTRFKKLVHISPLLYRKMH